MGSPELGVRGQAPALTARHKRHTAAWASVSLAVQEPQDPDPGGTLFTFVGKEAARTLVVTSRLCRCRNPTETQQPSSPASPWQPAPACRGAASKRSGFRKARVQTFRQRNFPARARAPMRDVLASLLGFWRLKAQSLLPAPRIYLCSFPAAVSGPCNLWVSGRRVGFKPGVEPFQGF